MSLPHHLRRLRFWQGFTQIEILIIVFIIGIMAAIAAPSFGGMLESARMKETAVDVRTAFQETQRQSIRNNQSCNTRLVLTSDKDRESVIKGSCLSSGDRLLPQGIGLATNVLPTPSPESSSGSSSTSPSGTSGSDTPSNLSDFSSPQNYEEDDDDDQALKFDPVRTELHNASLGDLVGGILCTFGAQSLWQPKSSGDSTHEKPDIEVGIQFGHLGAARFDIASEPGSAASNDHSAKFVSFRPNKIQSKKICVVLSGSLGLTRIGTYQGALEPLDITSSGKCEVDNWTEQ